MTSEHCIHLDYVRREADGRAVAVAVVTAGGPESARGEGWPPDPRFANDRALIGCIDDLRAASDERPAAWVVSVDGETELPAERLLDLVEWCAWVAAGTGAHLGAITIAERGGLRGDAAGGTRRLPDPDDVELVLRRVHREAAALGLDLVGAAPPVPARYLADRRRASPTGAPT